MPLRGLTFIQCECGGHAVSVEGWEDDEVDGDVVLEVWNNAPDNGARWGMRHRIRRALEWLHGTPASTSDVILRPSEARRLAELLMSIADEVEK